MTETIIQPIQPKTIAVIGAGIFGCMTAIKLAEDGFNVILIEGKHDILFGASYINQNRIHQGYHYPRSTETIQSCQAFHGRFDEEFKEAVVENFDHYYFIANGRSRINSKKYLEICDEHGLSYTVENPSVFSYDSNHIDLSIRVPEKIYDANILREKLHEKLIQSKKVSIMLSSTVTGLRKINEGYEITVLSENAQKELKVDGIAIATYSNFNRFLSMLNIPVKPYQYELVEIPVIRVPWNKRAGFTIMDGPFFGILPFGFSQEYLLYDVELSVLERGIGTDFTPKNSIEYYDDPHQRMKRFEAYIDKAKQFVPMAKDCQYLYSSYVMRMILPGREDDDARPTELLSHGNGVWSIFAGKITHAIPLAEEIAQEMVNYFRKGSA